MSNQTEPSRTELLNALEEMRENLASEALMRTSVIKIAALASIAGAEALLLETGDPEKVIDDAVDRSPLQDVLKEEVCSAVRFVFAARSKAMREKAARLDDPPKWVN